MTTRITTSISDNLRIEWRFMPAEEPRLPCAESPHGERGRSASGEIDAIYLNDVRCTDDVYALAGFDEEKQITALVEDEILAREDEE